MVFQLITFFLLVINFKSAEMDLSLKLPVVGSARPVETHGQRGLLVLNIDKAGDLKIYGRPIKNIEGYIRNEAQASMLQNRMTPDDIAAGQAAAHHDRDSRRPLDAFQDVGPGDPGMSGQRLSQLCPEGGEQGIVRKYQLLLAAFGSQISATDGRGFMLLLKCARDVKSEIRSRKWNSTWRPCSTWPSSC